jgi:hypothetical protein
LVRELDFAAVSAMSSMTLVGAWHDQEGDDVGLRDPA